MVRRLSVIGIGAGDPEYVTVQAIKALNDVDVFFFLDKGEAKLDLVRLRVDICERYIDHDRYRIVEVADPPRDRSAPAYRDAVRDWRDRRIALYEGILENELVDGQTGAFLVWGDPGIYDGTLQMLDAVRSRGVVTFELDVIPGISAVQALAARHQIALTRTGGSVVVTTARQMIDGSSDGFDDVVVMLDANCSFREIEHDDTTIFWGAYLGTPDEMLVSGTIADCGEEIERRRADGRRRKGWMFDTYLLRRRRAP